ncbi:MAG: hypothetical protein JWO36_7057 [Myxococcales bacterium]|nr:hypothetical protein [Myxococcales bacterium]
MGVFCFGYSSPVLRISCLVVLVACSAPAKQPRPIDAKPIENIAGRSCVEAATGLEGATKGLRPPESSVLDQMRNLCEAGAWPEPVRECFTKMAEGDLGRCARQLAEAPRNALLNALGGGYGPRAKIAVALARLETLQVGVAECDQFVAAVAIVLACEQMPVETRAELGTETADFWDLPTHGLRPDAQHRMATACSVSLSSLQQQAASVGCQL